MLKLGHILNKNLKGRLERSKHQRFSDHSAQDEGLFDFLKLVHNWEVIVGPRLCKHTIPLKNKWGTLTILTNHSAISGQISFMSEMIIQKVEKHFPPLKGHIKKLSFIVDSTHFQKRLEQLKTHKQTLGGKKLLLKENSSHESLNNQEKETRLHPYSPEYRQLKERAQSILGHLEDEEVKELLTSVYIQVKS